MNRLPPRRLVLLACATAATLLLSVAFDLTVFATAIYPALWITTLARPRRCLRPSRIAP